MDFPLQFLNRKGSRFFFKLGSFFGQMACIYLLNSRGGPQSFDFDITFCYPIIVTPITMIYSTHSSLKSGKLIMSLISLLKLMLWLTRSQHIFLDFKKSQRSYVGRLRCHLYKFSPINFNCQCVCIYKTKQTKNMFETTKLLYSLPWKFQFSHKSKF